VSAASAEVVEFSIDLGATHDEVDREPLRRAIAAREILAAKLAEADAAVARAQDMLHHAEAALHSFDHLEHRCDAYRAEFVRRSEGPVRTIVLPAELEEARRQRASAAAELAGARAVVEQLTNERDEAKAAVDDASVKALDMAEAIVCHRLEALADELRQTRKHATFLEGLLEGAGRVYSRVPSGVRAMKYPSSPRMALHYEPRALATEDAIKSARQYWDNVIRGLLVDPDIDLAEVPPFAMAARAEGAAP
jgi:hypothetical protein